MTESDVSTPPQFRVTSAASAVVTPPSACVHIGNGAWVSAPFVAEPGTLYVVQFDGDPAGDNPLSPNDRWQTLLVDGDVEAAPTPVLRGSAVDPGAAP